MRGSIITISMLVLLAGCSRLEQPADTSGLTAQEFVELYVGLREARARSTDAAGYEQQKAALFKKYNATPEAMDAFLKANSHDLTFMAAVWDSVQTRINASAEVAR